MYRNFKAAHKQNTASYCFALRILCSITEFATLRRVFLPTGGNWQRAGAFLHEQLALSVVFFAAISAPISCKKVHFQEALTWCGWNMYFSLETIELTPVKTMKLIEQLRVLLKSGKVKRKLLAQVLGLLIWATSLSLEQGLARAALLGPACTSGLRDFRACATMARVSLGTQFQGRPCLVCSRHLHAHRFSNSGI